ncbi:MAG: zinc ribbon domain-containing protein [Planctomycetaceae bacterium]|nr:zinc ribbon domain-containing protein [Planctomycetaceae bacterium]
MVCSNCGKALMEAAVFCIYCGTPVTRLVVTPFTGKIGRVPFALGKGRGIRSVVWTGIGWLMPLITFLLSIELLPAGSFEHGLWSEIVICLLLPSPFYVIAGIVYGIRGLNTEGWRYAYTGLVLSVLYILLIVVFFAIIVLNEAFWWL